MQRDQRSERRRLPPPEGPPWGLSWQEAPVAFIDLEMTGLDADKDRVLQVCIERVVDGELVDRELSFVRPPDGKAGPHTDIHGITDADLEGAPAFSDLAPRIFSMLEGAVVVAHSTKHDLAFLTAEAARHQQRWDCPYYLDTLALSRRALSAPSHRLHRLATHLGLDVGIAHRADGDVAILRQLFVHLIGVLKPRNPLDLWRIQWARHAISAEILQASKELAGSGKAVWLSYRASRRGLQRFRFHITKVRTDLDPPVVLGYLQHNRGRRELRVDRIVRMDVDEPNT